MRLKGEGKGCLARVCLYVACRYVKRACTWNGIRQVITGRNEARSGLRKEIPGSCFPASFCKRCQNIRPHTGRRGIQLVGTAQHLLRVCVRANASSPRLWLLQILANQPHIHALRNSLVQYPPKRQPMPCKWSHPYNTKFGSVQPYFPRRLPSSTSWLSSHRECCPPARSCGIGTAEAMVSQLNRSPR